MRFLGLIITLAAVGYAIHLYLGDSPVTGTEAEQAVDQGSAAVDAMNRALQQHQQTL